MGSQLPMIGVGLTSGIHSVREKSEVKRNPDETGVLCIPMGQIVSFSLCLAAA